MARIKLADYQIGEMDVQSTTYVIHIFWHFEQMFFIYIYD